MVWQDAGLGDLLCGAESGAGGDTVDSHSGSRAQINPGRAVLQIE